MSGSFEHVLENFQISKNFRQITRNFQHLSGIFSSSKHRPSGLMVFISQNGGLCVGMSVWPISGVASGRVCACSQRSRLLFILFLKVSCVCQRIYVMCLKITRLVHISGVCLEISSMSGNFDCTKTLYLFSII